MRPVRGGAEQDVFTRWRRLYCYTQRARVCKKVKTSASRRDRREARRAIRNGGDQ